MNANSSSATPNENENINSEGQEQGQDSQEQTSANSEKFGDSMNRPHGKTTKIGNTLAEFLEGNILGGIKEKVAFDIAYDDADNGDFDFAPRSHKDFILELGRRRPNLIDDFKLEYKRKSGGKIVREDDEYISRMREGFFDGDVRFLSKDFGKKFGEKVRLKANNFNNARKNLHNKIEDSYDTSVTDAKKAEIKAEIAGMTYDEIKNLLNNPKSRERFLNEKISTPLHPEFTDFGDIIDDIAYTLGWNYTSDAYRDFVEELKDQFDVLSADSIKKVLEDPTNSPVIRSVILKLDIDFSTKDLFDEFLADANSSTPNIPTEAANFIKNEEERLTKEFIEVIAKEDPDAPNKKSKDSFRKPTGVSPYDLKEGGEFYNEFQEFLSNKKIKVDNDFLNNIRFDSSSKFISLFVKKSNFLNRTRENVQKIKDELNEELSRENIFESLALFLHKNKNIPKDLAKGLESGDCIVLKMSGDREAIIRFNKLDKSYSNPSGVDPQNSPAPILFQMVKHPDEDVFDLSCPNKGDRTTQAAHNFATFKDFLDSENAGEKKFSSIEVIKSDDLFMKNEDGEEVGYVKTKGYDVVKDSDSMDKIGIKEPNDDDYKKFITEELVLEAFREGASNPFVSEFITSRRNANPSAPDINLSSKQDLKEFRAFILGGGSIISDQFFNIVEARVTDDTIKDEMIDRYVRQKADEYNHFEQVRKNAEELKKEYIFNQIVREHIEMGDKSPYFKKYVQSKGLFSAVDLRGIYLEDLSNKMRTYSEVWAEVDERFRKFKEEETIRYESAKNRANDNSDYTLEDFEAEFENTYIGADNKLKDVFDFNELNGLINAHDREGEKYGLEEGVDIELNIGDGESLYIKLVQKQVLNNGEVVFYFKESYTGCDVIVDGPNLLRLFEGRESTIQLGGAVRNSEDQEGFDQNAGVVIWSPAGKAKRIGNEMSFDPLITNIKREFDGDGANLWDSYSFKNGNFFNEAHSEKDRYHGTQYLLPAGEIKNGKSYKGLAIGNFDKSTGMIEVSIGDYEKHKSDKGRDKFVYDSKRYIPLSALRKLILEMKLSPYDNPNDIMPEDNTNVGGAGIFSNWWKRGKSFGEIVKGTEILVDVFKDRLTRNSDLKSAEVAAGLAGLIPFADEIRDATRIKNEMAQKEMMDKTINELGGIDASIATKRIQKRLSSSNTLEAIKEGALMFMMQKYGTLYAKDLYPQKGTFVWYKALGGSIGDSMYKKEEERCRLEGVNFLEENLLIKLLGAQCKGRMTPYRRSKLHKDFKGAWSGGIEKEVGDGEKDAGQKSTIQGRIDFAYSEMESGNLPWWGAIKQAIGKGGSMAQMDAIQFYAISSGIAETLDGGRLGDKIKNELGNSYLSPTLWFISEKKRIDIYMNMLVPLSRDINNAYPGAYPSIVHDTVKLFSNWRSKTGKEKDRLEFSREYWSKYGDIIANATSLSNNTIKAKNGDSSGATDKIIMLRQDEEPAYKAYYKDLKGAYAGLASYTKTADLMEDAYAGKGTSGILTEGATMLFRVNVSGEFTMQKAGTAMLGEFKEFYGKFLTNHASVSNDGKREILREYIGSFLEGLSALSLNRVSPTSEYGKFLDELFGPGFVGEAGKDGCGANIDVLRAKDRDKDYLKQYIDRIMNDEAKISLSSADSSISEEKFRSDIFNFTDEVSSILNSPVADSANDEDYDARAAA